MKRYRVVQFSIDASRNVMNSPEGKSWAEIQKKEMKGFLIAEFGDIDFDGKYKRYMELRKPVLIVTGVTGELTSLLGEISDAYTVGAFYPALTGACCLGERIFNQIIFALSSYYKSSPWYKELHGKGSILDWEKAISVLKDWGVLGDELNKQYRRLSQLRTDSVHFQQKEQDAAEMSLEAINIVNDIVEKLFGIYGPSQKQFLFYPPGEVYIKKDTENIPFVKEFYASSAFYVGYKHTVESKETPTGPKFVISDRHEYEGREISDEEFVALREKIEK